MWGVLQKLSILIVMWINKHELTPTLYSSQTSCRLSSLLSTLSRSLFIETFVMLFSHKRFVYFLVMAAKIEVFVDTVYYSTSRTEWLINIYKPDYSSPSTNLYARLNHNISTSSLPLVFPAHSGSLCTPSRLAAWQIGSLSVFAPFRFRPGEHRERETHKTHALIRGYPVGRHWFKGAGMAEGLEPTPAIAAHTLHHGVGFSAIPWLIPPVGENHLQAVGRAESLLQPIRAGKL